MITLYYGNDAYRLHETIEHLIAHSHDKPESPVSVFIINGQESDADEALGRALAYPTLFAEQKLIILTNALTMPESKQLLRTAAETDEDVVVAVVQDTHKLGSAEKRRLETLTKRASAVHRRDMLTGKERLVWLKDFCARRDRKITADAAAEVSRRAGTDTWALASELEKLCAYADTVIEENAVRLLVAAPMLRDEWELSNALTARDKRTALAALWRRLREGAPEQQLLGSLASATRTLLTVSELAGQGLSAGAIAKASGLHPFVITKNLRSAQNIDVSSLRATHVRLARLDRDVKRGRADIVDGMFSVLLGMA